MHMLVCVGGRARTFSRAFASAFIRHARIVLLRRRGRRETERGHQARTLSRYLSHRTRAFLVSSSLAGGARFYGRCVMLRSRLFHTVAAQPRTQPLTHHPSYPDPFLAPSRWQLVLPSTRAPWSQVVHSHRRGACRLCTCRKRPAPAAPAAPHPPHCPRRCLRSPPCQSRRRRRRAAGQRPQARRQVVAVATRARRCLRPPRRRAAGSTA